MHWMFYAVVIVAALGVSIFALAWVQGISARRSTVARRVMPLNRPADVNYKDEWLLLGDSAFSGVGLEYWAESVTAQLGRRVQGSASCLAQPGWSSGELHEAVAKFFVGSPDAAPEHAIINIGLNDTFRYFSARKTVKNIMQVCGLLQAKRRDVQIMVVGLPPIADLSILSWPLSAFLRGRIRRVNAALYPQVTQAGHAFLSVPPMSPELVSSDGLHPSARAHEIMAETMARHFAVGR